MTAVSRCPCPRSSSSARSTWTSFLANITFCEHFKDIEEIYTRLEKESLFHVTFGVRKSGQSGLVYETNIAKDTTDSRHWFVNLHIPGLHQSNLNKISDWQAKAMIKLGSNKNSHRQHSNSIEMNLLFWTSFGYFWAWSSAIQTNPQSELRFVATVTTGGHVKFVPAV